VSDDPDDRVAELERELAQAKATARFEHHPAAPVDNQLAPAPRRVPATFVLAELLPFRWWYIWGLFMVAVTLIVIWIKQPIAFAVTAVMALVVIYAFQLFGAARRLTLLKWGEVATVTGSEIVTRGTYYSGTTWYNSYLPVAHGWTVDRPRYSGPSTKTRVGYTLGGYQGSIVVRGREYYDGVVLADQRNPAHAQCVTSFAYDLDRDQSGNWVGRLRPRLVVGMAVWVLVLIGWLGVAGYAAQAGLAPHAAGTTSGPGGKMTVTGNGKSVELLCDNSDVKVSGNGNTVTVSGHCHTLTVSGSANHVEIDASDAIKASGVGNEITYHSGKPTITNSGVATTVHQG